MCNKTRIQNTEIYFSDDSSFLVMYLCLLVTYDRVYDCNSKRINGNERDGSLNGIVQLTSYAYCPSDEVDMAIPWAIPTLQPVHSTKLVF